MGDDVEADLLIELRELAHAPKDQTTFELAAGGVTFTIEYSGGSSSSLTLRALYDDVATVEVGASGREAHYRASAKGGGVSAIRPMSIVLRTETASDRSAKAAEINREYQTGDAEFDEDVYVDSPTTDETLLRAVLSEPVRASARDLLALGFDTITIDDRLGRVVAVIAAFGKLRGVSNPGERAARAFASLLGALPSVARTSDEHPKRSSAPLAFAIMGAVLALGSPVAFFGIASAHDCTESSSDGGVMLKDGCGGVGIAAICAALISGGLAAILASHFAEPRMKGFSDSQKRIRQVSIAAFLWSAVAAFVFAAAVGFALSGCHRSSSPPPPVAEPARAVDHEISDIVGAMSSEHVSADLATLVGFKTRNTCSTEINAARDFISARFASEGLSVALDAFDAPCTPPVKRDSVVGVLRGRDPTRFILLGAHYDSRSIERNDGTSPAPGANDSGSQTALLLEASRVLSGHAFDASIAFVAFAGEEQGLLGSTSVASHLASLFPGATLEAMLNCDIVGGDADANNADALHQYRVYAAGAPRETRKDTPDGTLDGTSPSRGLQHFIEAWGNVYVPDMWIIPKLREDRPGRGSDHSPFVDLGLPAVRFIETNETLAHQHTPDDVIAHVTPAYTTRIARVVTSILATLARAPRAPTNVTAERKDDRIELAWKPAGAADHFVVTTRHGKKDRRERVGRSRARDGHALRRRQRAPAVLRHGLRGRRRRPRIARRVARVAMRRHDVHRRRYARRRPPKALSPPGRLASAAARRTLRRSCEK